MTEPQPATIEDAIAMYKDKILYGVAYMDVHGRRIDPSKVRAMEALGEGSYESPIVMRPALRPTRHTAP